MVIELSCLYAYLSGVGKNTSVKIEIIYFSATNVFIDIKIINVHIMLVRGFEALVCVQP